MKNLVQTAFNRPAVVTDLWPNADVARKTILPARHTRAKRWHRDVSRVSYGMAQHISVSVVTVAIR
jgi:ectoine hydroxylase-related dioxygenase (phytanoyl-CoA dioxygenase family)